MALPSRSPCRSRPFQTYPPSALAPPTTTPCCPISDRFACRSLMLGPVPRTSTTSPQSLPPLCAGRSPPGSPCWQVSCSKKCVQETFGGHRSMSSRRPRGRTACGRSRSRRGLIEQRGVCVARTDPAVGAPQSGLVSLRAQCPFLCHSHRMRLQLLKLWP